jgi:hypothetical protein
MGQTRRKRDARNKRQEAERYHRAADAAIEQLDWVISYLHRIQKVKVAKALARNRTSIQRRLMRWE